MVDTMVVTFPTIPQHITDAVRHGVIIGGIVALLIILAIVVMVVIDFRKIKKGE